MKQKPYVHAMVMCDFVHRDGSGKFFLLGTFSKIFTRKVPTAHGPIGIYLVLSGWIEDEDLVIQIVHESTNMVGQMPPMKVKKHEKNEKIEFGLNLPPIPLAQAGRYDIQLLAGREMISQFGFEVVVVGEQEKE